MKPGDFFRLFLFSYIGISLIYIGAIIYSDSRNLNDRIFSAEEFPPGLYFVKLQIENTTVVKWLVILKSQ